MLAPMDPTHDLAAACGAWRALVDGLHAVPDPARPQALAAHLVHLYGAALRLPEHPPPKAAPPPPPWPGTWPGLGQAEGSAPDLSTLLRGLTADLDRGLLLVQEDPAAAAGWWRHTFHARWGTLLCAALPRLHEALRDRPVEVSPREPAPSAAEPVRAETPAPPPSRPAPTFARESGGGLLSFEPAPPERVSTDRRRAPATPEARGVLGVRFEPTPEGLAVTAVHPSGPAAGRLTAGDVLVAIDGMPLAGRDADSVRAALASLPGQTRELRVARGPGLRSVSVQAVLASDLPAPPLRLHVLVLDRDAVAALADTLGPVGVRFDPDPDQEGLVIVSAPPEAAAAVHATLADGAEQGLWDVLGEAP